MSLVVMMRMMIPKMMMNQDLKLVKKTLRKSVTIQESPSVLTVSCFPKKDLFLGLKILCIYAADSHLKCFFG